MESSDRLDAVAAPRDAATDARAWRSLVDRYLPDSVEIGRRLGLTDRLLEEAVMLAWLQLAQRRVGQDHIVPMFLAESLVATARRAGVSEAQVIDLVQSGRVERRPSTVEENR